MLKASIDSAYFMVILYGLHSNVIIHELIYKYIGFSVGVCEGVILSGLP